MIGCIIMVMVNNYPSSFIQNTFFKNQIHMPVAPAEGLFLRGVNFQSYNKKKDIPQMLKFDGVDSIDKIRQQIYGYIIEKDRQNWVDWLKKLKESIYYGIALEDDDKN